MICNSKVTIYHKFYDKTNRIEKWIRFNYDNAWCFGNKGSSINKGYDNANDIDVRLPYNSNPNLDITNFSISDIIVPQELNVDINREQDLSAYEIYNITSITNNFFGNNEHIHIGGK